MPKVAVYTRATTGGSRRRYVKAARGSTGPFFLRYEINGKRVWEGLGTRTYTFALADARSKESSLLREEATPQTITRPAEVRRGASNGIYPRQKDHVQEGRDTARPGHDFVLREGDARVSGHHQEIKPDADHQTRLEGLDGQAAGARLAPDRVQPLHQHRLLPSLLWRESQEAAAATGAAFARRGNTRSIHRRGDDEVLLRNHQGARLAGVRNDAEDWPTREELANLEWEHLDLGKTPTVSYKTRDNFRSAAFAQNNSDRLKGRLPIQRNLAVHHWLPAERNLSARFDWTCNAVRS